MGEFIKWLNANAGAVSALAALLTALATVAIAAFSWGTWQLYKLQRRSVQAVRAGMAVRILNMVHVTWSYFEILRKAATADVGNRDRLTAEMRKIVESVPNFRKDIKSLFEDVSSVDAAAVPFLNVAQARLQQLGDTAEKIIDQTTAVSQVPDLLVQAFKYAEAAGIALFSAREEMSDVDSLMTKTGKFSYPMYFYSMAGDKFGLPSTDEEARRRLYETSAE